MALAVGEDAGWLELFVAEARCRMCRCAPRATARRSRGGASRRRCDPRNRPGDGPPAYRHHRGGRRGRRVGVLNAPRRVVPRQRRRAARRRRRSQSSWADSAFSGAACGARWPRCAAPARRRAPGGRTAPRWRPGAAPGRRHARVPAVPHPGRRRLRRRRARRGSPAGRGVCFRIPRRNPPRNASRLKRRSARSRRARRRACRRGAHAGVAWRASASARRRGDAHAAAAWAHRAESVPGASRSSRGFGAALALAQLPGRGGGARPRGGGGARAPRRGPPVRERERPCTRPRARARRDDKSSEYVHTIGDPMTHRSYDGEARRRF